MIRIHSRADFSTDDNGGLVSMLDRPEDDVAAETKGKLGPSSLYNETLRSRQNKSRSSSYNCIFEQLPLILVWSIVCMAWILRFCHTHYLIPLVQSYERGEMEHNFYPQFHNEFTYYNRHCSAADITTHDAIDLLVRPDMTGAQAADIMLRHGAVAVPNILRNDTVHELRAYLAAKNQDTSKLGYNEVFWLGEDGTRISLALGADDDAVIRDALRQVGTHAVLQRTLEGILGPDPAIVEISTLTAKSGCDDQNIHSDSDWFGSSLLYGRTFLHSYSFFVALQDTPPSLGATTVCPGSHYCADVDLEAVCLEHGFEVSTNGLTGIDGGVLRQGDAFLFNQNIWHRGPANQAVHQQDRVMFILTFVSRADWERGDRRRQGLGTYYYQRWNMWGHTFQDLKRAGTVLRQPLAALRALGLFQLPNTHWGISWLHQVAQQMANGDDFYTESELADFKRAVLEFYNIPTQLYASTAEEWQPFLQTTFDLWVEWSLRLYAVCAAIILTLQCVVLPLLLRGKSTGSRVSFLKRCLVSHAAIAVLAYGMLQYIASTRLAQSISSGDIFVRSIPATTATPDRVVDFAEPSTLPERSDILWGTRYDAEFLASFNHFLDYHPGNQVWMDRVHTTAARLRVPALQTLAAVEMVDDLQRHGARFLRQDWQTGAWRLVGRDAAVDETRWSIRAQSRPWLLHLQTHLKHRLAELRFGRQRDTAWAKRFGSEMINHWLTTLRRLAEEEESNSGARRCVPGVDASCRVRERLRGGNAPATVPRERQEWSVVSRVPSPHRQLVHTRVRAPTVLFQKHYPFSGINDDLDTLMVGERVWVLDDETELWYEATLLKSEHDDDDGEDVWNVEYALGGTQQGVDVNSIRKYVLFQEGDRVEVDYNRNGEEFYVGTITHVHPSGGCTVLFDDGEVAHSIQREYMFLRADD